jgi:hypothetical protein
VYKDPLKFNEFEFKNLILINKIKITSQPALPCKQSPLVFLLGMARWHGEARETAELVYILCGADNPKTWIIMRNFRLIPVL